MHAAFAEDPSSVLSDYPGSSQPLTISALHTLSLERETGLMGVAMLARGELVGQGCLLVPKTSLSLPTPNPSSYCPPSMLCLASSLSPRTILPLLCGFSLWPAHIFSLSHWNIKSVSVSHPPLCYHGMSFLCSRTLDGSLVPTEEQDTICPDSTA